MSGGHAQVDALARAFFARFFESDVTTGSDDMKQSFFWLLAALAMPGLMIPWLMSFDWNMIGRFEGYEVLRVASRGEKAFYLALSMLAAGGVTAIAWTSLLPDTRDTLILGAMPVRPRTVVAAKLAALGAYVLLIAAGTHAVGSFFWGSLLGNDAPLGFLLMGIVAHFAASSAITISASLAMAAAQGLTLAALGPRLFRTASTLLQITVVGLIAVFLAVLPAINMATPETIAGEPGAQPWLLSLPPLWFLGLYEWMLGTDDPVLVALARRAGITLALCIAITVVTYPLAYRRLMVSVVETGSQRRNLVARALRGGLVRSAGRHPAVLASADFFTATLARVERQRFIIAIALGLAIAWSLPGLRSYVASAQPQPSLLALPIAVMMFLLAGLRIASSLPGEVRAGWVFEVHDISRRHARQSLERVMFVLGIVPPGLVSTPIYWYLWGPAVAIAHAAVLLALGVAVIELLIWHCDSVPCGQQWIAARMGFGRKWPLHAGAFLLAVAAVPRLEVVLFRTTYGTSIFVAGLIVFALAVRYASARHQIVATYEDVDPVAGVLRIR